MADRPVAEMHTLASLTPAGWNPRKISDERFKNLCRSIESDPDFLWLRPVLATPDGAIYGGNMRYRAAQHLGLATIPAIITDIPEKLARERALRDNAQWGEWDDTLLADMLAIMQAEETDMSLLGFDDRELVTFMAGKGGGKTDPDDIPEPPAVPISKTGDLWLLGNHRVLCGDSTNPEDVARLMNGEKARLMATDPPYLVDYTGASHPPSKANRPDTRDKNWDEYKDPASGIDFFAGYIASALPHLDTHAAIYQWHADRRYALVDAAWRRCGLNPHQIIVWVKARAVLTFSQYMQQHEPCLYGWLQGNKPSIKPPANVTTVWEVDQKGEQDGIHPTQKPVELFRRPLNYHTLPGDLCYEPFLGSGTCLIAAEELGRRCFGMEQEPTYVDVVVRRWENFTGLKAVLEKIE